MNWYKRSQVGLIKTAAFKQEEWAHSFGDYQRWVVDAYEVRLFKTKTPAKITISLNVWNGHLGEMTFQEFWKYGSNEDSKASTAYRKMVGIAEDVTKQFTSGEDSEAPNNQIANVLRAKMWEADRENLAKSNIPSINYSRQKASYEPDWRSSLYGNRYPTGETSGF
jgi:hypothetical protein